MTSRTRYTLPKSLHLRLPREFEAVYAGKTREGRGPVTVYALPNDLGHARMGLSVSRKVGTAVRRNRIRRRLREAFRLMQHDFPRGYDLVAVVRPHEPSSWPSTSGCCPGPWSSCTTSGGGAGGRRPRRPGRVALLRGRWRRS